MPLYENDQPQLDNNIPVEVPQLRHRRRRHKYGSGKPIKDWLPFRELFLNEIIRLEGLGDVAKLPLCGDCGVEVGDLRCTDCMLGTRFCTSCVVSAHQKLLFHRLQRWNGSFHEKCTLYQAGLRIQLGHDGHTCPKPVLKTSPMTIIDVSGVHDVHVNFCACGIVGASHHTTQLLRASLWPATVHRPQSAITIRTLKLFHVLNLQSKLNVYNFWCTLRTGHAHVPSGIESTKQGGFAVQCPLCPQPGMNMPDGWEDAPEDER
ncbi:hypothetical protein FA95DRAFT_1585439 [Auriscalpium vulgare]|uniref:Uncharacterized protein n=1 Tax=Auriscalpium vulgare TaxID=40419 RepID=A0ACB8R4B3_9AGAM|nr:hypothetical protein FA95DRAFT_1585439 [Auriscalpium vulgare]